MNYIRRPQNGNTSGGPYQEGHMAKSGTKSPVRKKGKKNTKRGY